MKNVNCLTDHILNQILKIISSISLKKHETVSDNLPIRIYVNYTKTGLYLDKREYYLKLLTPETVKLP